jgi:MOSC domain-containing protein YiiM
MIGHVTQVSLGPGGIPNYPVDEAFCSPLGLEGDHHLHPQFHGGPKQALLLVSSEFLDRLREDRWPLYPGALGENLTTQGIDFRQVRMGQRYRVGETIIEISKVRQPCQTLSPYGHGIQKALYDERCKANDHTSPLWGLSGFYARVIQTGTVRTGDPIQLLDQVA